MITTASEPDGLRFGRRDMAARVGVAVVGGAAVAAVLLTGQGRTAAMVVAAGVAGALVMWAAIVRFELFVLILLATRSSLDLADGGGTSVLKPSSLLGVMLIGAGVVWLWDNRALLPRRNWSAFSVGFVGFALTSILSVIPLADPLPVVGDVLAVVAGLVMFLCVERLLIFGTPISRIMIAMAAATAIPMTFGLLGERLGADTYHLNAGVRALRSTFVLSNNFAYFLLPVIVLAIPIGHRSRGSLRLGLYALAALGSVLLVLTQTRGAWIGAVAGVVVIGILENRRLILALLAIVTCALVLAPGVNDRVTEISTETQARRDENSLEWRLEQWAEIVDWNDQNRLTGIGLGMVIQLDEAAKAPHNDYLRAYVETGVVGLSFYILLVGGFVRAAWIGHRRQLAGWQGGLLVGIFAYSIVFAITSIAENLIVSVAFLWYAMTLGAIANFVAYNDRSADLAGDGRRKRVVNSARDEVKA